MREIRTEIDIAAPPSTVWSILTDFNNWSVWNPIVNQASGVASVGSKLSMTMRGEDGKDGPKYAPVVTEFNEPKYFRWRATMMVGFLFTNEKIFELEVTDAGTRLIHIETFSGIMVPMCWSKMEGGVPVMLKEMNAALKTLAEKSADS